MLLGIVESVGEIYRMLGDDKSSKIIDKAVSNV